MSSCNTIKYQPVNFLGEPVWFGSKIYIYSIPVPLNRDVSLHDHDYKAEYLQQLSGSVEYQDYEYPKVSFILPTLNCAQKISGTIKSLLYQEYPSFEIIVIDAASNDRTVEIIKSFQDEKITLFSVSQYHRYEMLNKGISQSTGQYLNFIFPGDYLISPYVLKIMMAEALQHSLPHMLYCGTVLRNGRSDVKLLFRPLDKSLLRHGQQPTSLQACFFHRSVFEILDKFDPSYSQRGGFDLLCRFILEPGLQAVAVHRVLMDFDLRVINIKEIWQHFSETARIIRRHFGFGALIIWMFRQRDTGRLFHLWVRSIKIAFLGRR